MSSSVQIVLNTLTLVALLMVIGYVSVKSDLIQQDHLPGISKFIVIILLPMAILNMIINGEAQAIDYMKAMPYLGMVCLVYLGLYLLGKGLASLLKLSGKRKDVFRMFMIFGNIGFFGIPLITGIYPGSLSYLHLTQHNIIDALVMWTLGVMILTHHLNKRSFSATVKHMINPTIGALLLGLILMGFGIKMPTLPNLVIKGLAEALKTISLVYMGMLLASIDVRPLLKEKSIYVLIGVKMFLIPIIIYVCASFFLIDQSAVTMALLFGTPGMVLVSILAALYDSDKAYAAGVVFMTTVAALITLPLLVSIFSYLQPVLK
jgi:predicted permease